MVSHPAGLCSVVESLEPRLAPAGIITLTTAGGVLTITGDTGDNSIRITDVPATGMWAIAEPVAGTTYVLNGVTQANVPFDIPAQGGIKANLGGGDDQLEIIPSTGATGMVLSVLSIVGGKGEDKIALGNNAAQSLQVLGATTVDTGDGDDTVFVAGSAGFGGAANFKLGSGKDILFFPNVAQHAFLKGVKIDLGVGEKALFIASTEFEVSGGSFSVVGAGAAGVAQNIAIAPTSGTIQGPASIAIAGGDVTLDVGDANKALRFGSTLGVVTGGGLDLVTFDGTIDAAGAVTVDMKAGNNSFTLANDSELYTAALSVKGAGGVDFVSLNLGSVLTTLGTFNMDFGPGATNAVQFVATSVQMIGGAMNILGGAGIDNIALTGITRVTGGVTLDLKDGANVLSVSSNLIVDSLTIKGGIGNDMLAVGLNTLLQSSGAVTLSLGAGNNSFLAASNSAFIAGSFNYAGGAGDDSFTVDGSVFSSLGATTWNPGAGANTFDIEPTAYTFLGGAVKINGGKWADTVRFKGLDVRIVGALTVALGDGPNDVIIESPLMNLGASLSYTGGSGADALSVGPGKLYVAGAVTIKGGNGSNEISLGATSGSIGGVSFTGGTGTDLFQIGAANLTTRIHVTGGLSVMAGTGISSFNLYAASIQGATNFKSTGSASDVDTLFFEESTFNGAVSLSMGKGISTFWANDSTFRSTVNVDLGDGDDVVRLDTLGNTSTVNQWFGKVIISGGAGADTFNLGANPVSATRGN
ncbi:MAG TPA: hypothetical protein VD994_12290, partial [Prosthecobacter sp.]|nr:hypothetical protein [Prosthecobacter sp.]